jgi:hypothetical protein
METVLLENAVFVVRYKNQQAQKLISIPLRAKRVLPNVIALTGYLDQLRSSRK